MTRILIAASFCLCTLLASAQTQPTVPIDSLTKAVQRFINYEEADSLHNLMSADLKRQVSSEQLNEFIGDLVGQLGRWVSFEQKASVNGVTEYRALFPLGVLRFYISQDTAGKIAQFSFVPESE